jgi:hypothetical protein
MEKPRLIPYSVHLPADVHAKLKEAAGNRKASSLVRDAITLIIDGDDEFNGGYNKGVRDSISIVLEDEYAKSVAVNGRVIAHELASDLEELIVPQNTKGKHGQEKA